jgi:RNA polymerase sigma-70 factor (ECF subfamily)
LNWRFSDLPPRTEALSARAVDDPAAAGRLMALVYEQLRGLAGRYLWGQEGHTLQPTALVHEAFLRIAAVPSSRIRDRAHFAALCAVAMRQILANHARKRQTLKRGARVGERLGLTGLDARESRPPVDVLALDEALDELARLDERQAHVVQYRYFGGLTVPEVAQVLGVSRSTVEDDWRMARAWLRVRLREADER